MATQTPRPKSHRPLSPVANTNTKPLPNLQKSNPERMEGDEIFASIESLWFYSGVFLRPSSKQTSGELRPRGRDPTGSHSGVGSDGGGGCQDPECSEEEDEVVVVAAGAKRRRAAAAGSREMDRRMEMWQETRVVAAPARCSPSPPLMPAPGDGLAMKAHLRSWAHAVACSVR